MKFVFETDKVDDYEDEVIISSEYSNDIRIKLYAKKPKPLIKYNPLINFGFVPLDSKKVQEFEIENLGAIGVNLELNFATNMYNDIIKIDYKKFKLKAYEPYDEYNYKSK